jgi:hypothetical protein
MQALLTIQPTSTCSERVFLVAGGFSTMIRNRLAYIMLNAQVFLKYYFIKGKKKKIKQKHIQHNCKYIFFLFLLNELT